jgi:REP element-mobilizing transposase RayT
MKSRFDPQIHHRRSIRLKDYDYASEGAYFVTTVTQGRVCIFGEIVDGKMRLNRYGEIVQEWWNEIPIHFPNVEIGAFVIMPNHVHGIIFILDQRTGAVFPLHNGPKPLRISTLGQIIAYFKYQSTKEMNLADGTGTIAKFWQRNYYERIIRNEKELKQKTDYILDNPSRWHVDQENLTKKSPGYKL